MSSQGAPVQEFPFLPERLHVLTLTPFYPVRGDDGQGCFVSEPLSWLARLGVASTIRVSQPFYRSGAGADDSSLPAEWVRFFSLPGGIGLSTAGAFLFARVLGDIRRLHASDPVHLIHAHAALPCGHAAWLLGRELKIPFVVTVHGLDAFSTRQVRGLAGKWCEQVSRSVYRAARSVICVSEHVRTQVMEGAPGLAHATVVYNGVDPTKFFLPEEEPQKAMILSVGNLIPIKGHELLLRAFASIQDEFAGATLEIIGDGPERSGLEKLARAEGIGGKVRFWGRQSRLQVANAMRRATIFALPSRYEGLGCVYLEAMSAGRPVIACRGQGIEEIIQDGANGCLIDADDQPGLAETLSALLRQADLRRKMGGAARETVMQGYTQALQAARLLQLYRECRE